LQGTLALAGKGKAGLITLLATDLKRAQGIFCVQWLTDEQRPKGF